MKKETLLVAFSTQKGGAGKTTLTVLMASYFYYVKGMDVVVVDCDYPQYSIKDMRERDIKNIERNPRLKKTVFELYAKVQKRMYPIVESHPETAIEKAKDFVAMETPPDQMALFVIFESGLQMLADNPTLYYRNEDCTRFITQVPVTWDETVVLEAKVVEYVIVAKRKGEKWFIGGMTNDKENEREFEINLDFLKDGRTYRVTSFEDGINAGYQAMDYRMKSATMNKNQKLSVKMARNGGFAAVLE